MFKKLTFLSILTHAVITKSEYGENLARPGKLLRVVGYAAQKHRNAFQHFYFLLYALYKFDAHNLISDYDVGYL